MTNPLGSFKTQFGRFYAHPSSRQSTESQSGSMLRSLIGAELDDDPNLPYSPKPSITNIMSVMSKDFLPPYYAKLVAEYAVDNLAGIEETVRKFGPKVAVGQLKGIVNQPHPAGPIGDEVHAAIDAFLTDGFLPEDFQTITAARMFGQFKHFSEVSGFKFLRTEYTAWSYEHGYAGTGDLLAQNDQGLWVIDNKTGNQVHPEVAMQTAAIANADVILLPDGSEIPMPATDVLGVLHIRPMSVKLHRLEREAEAFEAFLACKRIFDWRRFDQELVIQEPLKFEKPKLAA